MSRVRNLNLNSKNIESNRRPVPPSHETHFVRNDKLKGKMKTFRSFLRSLEPTEGVILFGLKYLNKIPPKSKRLLFGEVPLSISDVRQKSISTVVVGDDFITKLYYSLLPSDLDYFINQLDTLISWNSPNELLRYGGMDEIFKISKKIGEVDTFFVMDSPRFIQGPRVVRLLKIDSVINKLIEKGVLDDANYNPELNTAYLEPKIYKMIVDNYPSIIVSIHEQLDLKIAPELGEAFELDAEIVLPIPDRSRPIVGVIDAGCSLGEVFNPYIENIYDVRETNTSHDYFHGTAVSSLIIAHDEINPSAPDGLGNFRVRHFEMLKQRSDPTSYFHIRSVLDKVVRNNSDIKIWNLSFGGIKVPYDVNISELGILLDELSSEMGVIFVIASGNQRDKVPNWFESLNSPGDSLNSLTVGSVKRDEKYNYAPSLYSSAGPILHYEKPEVSSFGGPNNFNNTPLGLQSNSGIVFGRSGTSFAAPKITRHIANYISQGYEPLEAKAKVIATAVREERQRRKNDFPGWKSSAYGVVNVEENTYDLKATLTLNGKKPVYFPIDLVDGITEISMVSCFATSPKPDLGEEYSISNVELGLIWHEDIKKPEWHNRSKMVKKDIETDNKLYGKEVYQRYENAKWFPTTKIASSITEIMSTKRSLIDDKNIPNPILSLRIRKQDLFETIEEQSQKISVVILFKGDFDFNEFERRNTQIIEAEIEQEIELVL